MSNIYWILEDMPSLKPSLPYGQVPLLEVDGDTICQSMAIARYLASECGLAGSSSLVKAQVDEVVDVINDVQNAMVSPSIVHNNICLFRNISVRGIFRER